MSPARLERLDGNGLAAAIVAGGVVGPALLLPQRRNRLPVLNDLSSTHATPCYPCYHGSRKRNAPRWMKMLVKHGFITTTA